MSKASISTLVGLIIGISCILFSILEGGEPISFVNIQSIFITLGGTLGAVVVSFPPKRLKSFIPVLKVAFKKEKTDFISEINKIVELSVIAKKEGIISLEKEVQKYADDKFLVKGILLIVDGNDEESLRYTLEGDTYFMQKRHQEGVAMFDMIAATAPALGLLGTYIGLIPMLNNLEDPTKLGPMMALELVTSFYGAFIAYVLFSPIAKRLKILNSEEITKRELVIEGIISIRMGKNPKLIKEQMISYLNIKEYKGKSSSATPAKQRRAGK